MDLQIALLLGQDGIVNGAIYALLALALVLVFAVTRVIFIPQGEFVAYGALTLAAFQAGKVPGTIFFLVGIGTLVSFIETICCYELEKRKTLSLVYGLATGLFLLAQYQTPIGGLLTGLTGWFGFQLSLAIFFGLSVIALLLAFVSRDLGTHKKKLAVNLVSNLVAPVLLLALAFNLPLGNYPILIQVSISMIVVVPLGPMIYRLAYQPLAEASVLVLLIVSVAVHLALVGLGLLFFGAEGSRTTPFSEAQFNVGTLTVNGQTLWVLGASCVLIVALYLFFGRTLYGKALRATAINRTGARLMGISTTLAGKLSFTLAAGIGALSGILIAPITTVYYDTGFLVGLKGFVAAIIAGLMSYPLAAAGAILVGLLESFSSFWASAFKEVIVFTLIIPVLVWRSLTSHHVEEEE